MSSTHYLNPAPRQQTHKWTPISHQFKTSFRSIPNQYQTLCLSYLGCNNPLMTSYSVANEEADTEAPGLCPGFLWYPPIPVHICESHCQGEALLHQSTSRDLALNTLRPSDSYMSRSTLSRHFVASQLMKMSNLEYISAWFSVLVFVL